MNKDQEDELEKQINNVRAFKSIFDSQDGQVILDHLKKICHFETSTISPLEKRDLSQWREGRRSVVLDMISLSKTEVSKFKENFKIQMKKNKEANEGDRWL